MDMENREYNNVRFIKVGESSEEEAEKAKPGNCLWGYFIGSSALYYVNI